MSIENLNNNQNQNPSPLNGPLYIGNGDMLAAPRAVEPRVDFHEQADRRFLANKIGADPSVSYGIWRELGLRSLQGVEPDEQSAGKQEKQND